MYLDRFPVTRQMLDIARELRFRSPLRRSFYKYEFMFTPRQLAFLCDCLARTRGSNAPIVEIGCAAGRTTVWLCKYLEETNDERRYFCLDTFSGFTDADVAHEVAQRGKRATALAGFDINKKRWFDQTMRDNEVDRVTSVQADISAADVGALTDHISFCLLDVDLYLPTKNGLAKLFPLMEKGGIIVVDDVMPGTQFDGAHQAYLEFVRERGLPERIELGKLGIIEV